MGVRPDLTDHELERYRRDGFLFPVDVLTAEEALVLAGSVEEHLRASERGSGLLAALALGPKVHLLWRWADALVRDNRLLGPVRRVLGPDLLVWGTSIFVKAPGAGTPLAWHQDALTYGLDGAAIGAVRVWLALTPATPENGPLCYLAGSHELGVLPHRRANSLEGRARGDEVCLDVSRFDRHEVVARPGQCSLHNLLVVHGSGVNTTGSPRLSIAIDYVSTAVRPMGPLPDSALPVSGRGDQGHFLPETPPRSDLDDGAVQELRRAAQRRLRRLAAASQAALASGAIVRAGAGPSADGTGDGASR